MSIKQTLLEVIKEVFRKKFHLDESSEQTESAFPDSAVLPAAAAEASPQQQPFKAESPEFETLEAQAYDTHPPAHISYNAEHILECRALVKRFGRKVAVRGVNISMKTSQITGLLGPNGAGKTTIFYMIVGFIQPNDGGVYLDHHLLSELPMHKRAQLGIAYLPQEPSVFRKLTVEKNIWAILETRSDLTHAEKKHELEGLLNEFGIQKIRKQFAYTLSGGERRRTEIARALAIKQIGRAHV